MTFDELKTIDLARCELQLRLQRLQVDHAHILADLYRSQTLLVDDAEMSLTESERLRLPMGLPFGATDRRDLPNVLEGSLLPVFAKPMVSPVCRLKSR